MLSFETDGEALIYFNDERMIADQFPNNTITIASNGDESTYDLAVSNALGKSNGMDATADDNDDRSGASASGQVDEGGRDSYGFSGEITSFELDGGATVYRNGEAIDPDKLPNNTLTISSTGERASYEVNVDGDIEKRARNGATIDDNDDLSGTTATGQVGEGGRDSYSIAGDITNFELDGDAVVYLNDDQLSAEELADM